MLAWFSNNKKISTVIFTEHSITTQRNKNARRVYDNAVAEMDFKMADIA